MLETDSVALSSDEKPATEVRCAPSFLTSYLQMFYFFLILKRLYTNYLAFFFFPFRNDNPQKL